MAEQDSKPTSEALEETPATPEPIRSRHAISARQLLPLGLGLVALLVGCVWWGAQSDEAARQDELAAPAAAVANDNRRSEQAAAALTRVASSLAHAQEQEPTATPTAVAANSALIPLPTVTPTIVPSPVATRTIEVHGDATLRMQLNSEAFESNGQPVNLELEPRSYVLGGDSMTQSDQWCMQVGPTGLVFDLTFTLQPVTENLHVGGALQLYDGFCGTLGNLGNLLATAPMDVTVPVGTSAILAPSLQFQGSFMGLPNVLDISTGVFLNLAIRNPIPD